MIGGKKTKIKKRLSREKNNGAFLRRRKYGGFSFIESMVAVVVLSTGIIVSVSLISKALQQTLDSRNQVIAGLLAEEGVELVRNIRDNNWASGLGSFTAKGLNAAGGTRHCRIDTTFNYSTDSMADPLPNKKCGLTNFVQGNSPSFQLYTDNTTGLYSYAPFDLSGVATPTANQTPTRFYRKVCLNWDGATTETIYSIVVWDINNSVAASQGTCGNPTGIETFCKVANKCVYSKTIMTQWGE